jgi:hypothetical protein
MSTEQWTLVLVVGILLLLVMLMTAIYSHIRHRREIDARHDLAHANMQTVVDKILVHKVEPIKPVTDSVEGLRGQYSADYGKFERMLRSIESLVERIAKLLGITQKTEPLHPMSKTPPPDRSDTQ